MEKTKNRTNGQGLDVQNLTEVTPEQVLQVLEKDIRSMRILLGVMDESPQVKQLIADWLAGEHNNAYHKLKAEQNPN